MFTLGAVKGLQVSELAERAGVAASTVRFYYDRILRISLSVQACLASGCRSRSGLAWFRSPGASCLSLPMASAAASGGLIMRVRQLLRCCLSAVP
jgi:hypothetical protein